MKNPLLASLMVTAVGAVALSTASFAGPNAGANIELHILGTTTKNACTRASTLPGCFDLVKEGDLGTYYFLHVLVTDGSAAAGVAGLQFGILYGSGILDGVGIDIFSWTLCASLEFPQPSPVWPNDGAGTLITWDPANRCQTFEPEGPGNGVTANAGYFYMAAYSPATFYLTPRPVDGLGKVASCAGEEDVLSEWDHAYGTAAFGMAACPPWSLMCAVDGDPCGPTPTVEATWSAVKSLYK